MMFQCKHHSWLKKKKIILASDIDKGGGTRVECVGTRVIVEILELTSQFCCKTKTALKNKVLATTTKNKPSVFISSFTEKLNDCFFCCLPTARRTKS